MDASKATKAAGASQGEGSAANDAPKGWSGADLPRGYQDVTDQVDVRGLDFLNIDGERGNARTVFAPEQPSSLNGKDKEGSSNDWIESDTDEQLMLFIPFQSTMKLHTLQITSLPPTDGDEETPMRPKTLKLYSNRTTTLGFDEADDTASTQTIEIKDSDWNKHGTAKVELRFVKFQNISSIVIFVVDGSGDGEKTRIDRIRLVGESGEKKAMGKLTKVGEEES